MASKSISFGFNFHKKKLEILATRPEPATRQNLPNICPFSRTRTPYRMWWWKRQVDETTSAARKVGKIKKSRQKKKKTIEEKLLVSWLHRAVLPGALERGWERQDLVFPRWKSAAECRKMGVGVEDDDEMARAILFSQMLEFMFFFLILCALPSVFRCSFFFEFFHISLFFCVVVLGSCEDEREPPFSVPFGYWRNSCESEESGKILLFSSRRRRHHSESENWGGVGQQRALKKQKKKLWNIDCTRCCWEGARINRTQRASTIDEGRPLARPGRGMQPQGICAKGRQLHHTPRLHHYCTNSCFMVIRSVCKLLRGEIWNVIFEALRQGRIALEG